MNERCCRAITYLCDFNPSVSAWLIKLLSLRSQGTPPNKTHLHLCAPRDGSVETQKAIGESPGAAGAAQGWAFLPCSLAPDNDSPHSFLHLCSYSWKSWSREIFVQFGPWFGWSLQSTGGSEPHTNSTEELASNKMVFIYCYLPVVKTLSSCHEWMDESFWALSSSLKK